MTNAIKFTEKGHIAVSLDTQGHEVGGDNYLGRSLTIVLTGGEESQAA